MNAPYVFVGEGRGIPGLPHEITAEEADASGLRDLLLAAIANGNYRQVQESSVEPGPAARRPKRKEGE